MASTNCWRCLARPSQRLLVPASITSSSASSAPVAAFTTSATRQAPREGAGGRAKHIRSGKKSILGKKKRQIDRTKPPLPGERKAFRKRIQLSNDNALAVPGLQEMTTKNLVNPNSVGRVVGLPPAIVDQLRACEAFKPTQNWHLFRSPHLLIRHETVDLVNQITDAIAKKETLRTVITGEKGSGKSILGLQALSAGFMNEYVVIHIPEAQELTTAATEYAPISHSKEFAQPVYTVKLLQTIFKNNQHILSRHKVELDYMHLPITISRNMSLAALINATKEPEFAWPVFETFWKELLRPGRPPVLFVLDGLHHIMRISDYRSPSFERIHSHDLSLVRLFAEALGGRTAFANGGAVLGVCTKGNPRILPAVDKALEQAAAAQAGLPTPERDPFCAYDERVFAALRGVRVLDVGGVSRPEARALMEYWAASGILRLRVDEPSVCEKWTMSGGGVLAEMEKLALFDIRMST
ncbi:mitochondrial ribosomal death-associated protein 3-domain-containing protein [Xylariaceae sp. FL0662B]|nr:mitochondrial ribosomal death-associated protein 3-domain-containing protein [Xylariaceae sp. FL0662B]